MTARALAAVAPLVLFAGCVDEQRVRVVPPGTLTETTTLRPPRLTSPVSVTEETARRVLLVGRKVVEGNTATGLRPMFLTVGAPHVEIFHQGGGARPLHVYVTEGLVRRCKDDAELAAVLCHEMARIVNERATLDGPDNKQPGEDRLAGVGNDAGGAFGPPDGTRLLEQGSKERQRPRKKAPPSVEDIARRFLTRAGYAPEALAVVAPLLREAEKSYVVEKHLQPGEAPVRLLSAGSAP
jgi:predicted Zn-dependent protease